MSVIGRTALERGKTRRSRPGGLGLALAIAQDPNAGLPRLAAVRGDIATVRIGPRRIVLVNEPGVIRDVLAGPPATFTKGDSMQGLSMLLGAGLITSEGELHARQRRAVQGHFGQGHEAAWVSPIVDATHRRTESWRSGDVLDAEVEMLGLSLDVTLHTLFHDQRTQDELDRVRAAVATMAELSALSSLPGARVLAATPLPQARRFRAARETLRRWAIELIARRRADPAPPEDVLQAVLRSSADLADEAPGGPIDQVLTFLVAAHVTTGHALAWALDAVARHRDVASALAGEAAGETLRAEAAGTGTDARHLPYCRAVFAEALRLFPPAWVIGRQATMSTELADVHVGRTDLVVVSPWVTQRDGRWFARSDEFLPERWLGDERPTKFSYFPFGLGARRCVGEPLAWLVGTMALAVLGSRWRFEAVTDEPPRPRSGITLSARGGLPLRVHRLPA